MVRLRARQLFDVWPVLMCLYRAALQNSGRRDPAQVARTFALA